MLGILWMSAQIGLDAIVMRVMCVGEMHASILISLCSGF